MKKTFGFAACAVLISTSTSCAYTPDLLEQNAANGTPILAKQVLIVVNDEIFATPFFGPPGRSYLKGLGAGLQNALPGIPTSVVDIGPMMLTNPLPPALQALRPSHIIKLYTVSSKQRDGRPVSAVWQMSVATVTIAQDLSRDSQHAITHFIFKPVYKARVEGDTCLLSNSGAEKCGATMGQFLGKTLLAAHSVRTSADN